jgi:outer membrane protein insertion porin family
VSPYKTVSTGAGIRLGWPIAEDDQVNFGLTADQTEITTYDASPLLYKDFCKENGSIVRPAASASARSTACC